MTELSARLTEVWIIGHGSMPVLSTRSAIWPAYGAWRGCGASAMSVSPPSSPSGLFSFFKLRIPVLSNFCHFFGVNFLGKVPDFLDPSPFFFLEKKQNLVH